MPASTASHPRHNRTLRAALAAAFAIVALAAPFAAPVAASKPIPSPAPLIAHTALAIADTKPVANPKPEKLTLDRIFPKKSFWGPGARDATFSHDGRFAAFLYRPYIERRHGTDLYIHDTKTGQTRRITSVGRMTEFQAEARKVAEDREKKAKKAKVTLEDLADEQAIAMKWADAALVGTWEGPSTAPVANAALPAGQTTLTVLHRPGLILSGDIRIGLARLPITSITKDPDATNAYTATLEDKALSISGQIKLTLTTANDATNTTESLSGSLTLKDQPGELTFTLARKAHDDSKADAALPKGVLNSIGERLTLADVVLKDDAEINDEVDGKAPSVQAPRYAGVSSIQWSPTSVELMLLAEGDIFRLTIDPAEWDKPLTPPAAPEPTTAPSPKTPAASETPTSDASATDAAESGTTTETDTTETTETSDVAKTEPTSAEPTKPEPAKKDKKVERKPTLPYRGVLTRETRTREREADVQYLPDGSGYTYLRAGALIRISFGDHRIIQLDPELKDGERMVGYRISPDQRRLVFLATRGQNTGATARQVTIVNYRDRFARAQQVARHMPDDPWPESYSSVYLYDLTGHDTEEGKLERVFTRRVSGPRDIMRVPEWSLDSSRIAFAAYDQQTGHMKILEAGFVPDESKKKPDQTKPEPAPATPPATTDSNNTNKDGTNKDDTDGSTTESTEPAKPLPLDQDPDAFKIENARVVYQFLHHGGPNTPGMVLPMYLPDSRRMIFITELSGFRQLHLLDPRYEALSQITEGNYEIYPFHHARDKRTLFFTATKDDPNQEQAYKLDLDSFQITRLTPNPGVYSSIGVREDGSALLAMHVDFGAPAELVSITTGDQPTSTTLTDSHPEEAHKLTRATPEYFTYENRHGHTIHGHMFKPADWTPQDKRPLLIYVYGGPLGERKMATRGAYAEPSYFFARYMAENHGYVTVTIDPRGASGYGAVFEKANFEQVGKPQTEDLVDGARWLVKHHGVDEKKMAMHGWSFGGFQTQMVMYTEPDVFAVGIAGAGPTEWHNYNSWYSTGTIGANNPGKTDLEKYSLLPLAKNLKGKLLLVHGVEDSNVLYQDTVRVYRELLKADKEVNVELFIDPTGGHGLGGDVKSIGRYRKYEDFILRHLGKGTPATPPTPAPTAPEAAATSNP